VQKRLNRSICRIGCRLEWAEGCTNSIVFARWCQCALMEGHVAVTCRITLNHPSMATMRLMSNYFDHLLSCTRLLRQSHRQPSASSRALYCGHSTQYSHLVPVVDMCLSCEDIARQSCAMVSRWRFFGDFLRPVFSASHVQRTFQTCILNSHYEWKYGRHSICDG